MSSDSEKLAKVRELAEKWGREAHDMCMVGGESPRPLDYSEGNYVGRMKALGDHSKELLSILDPEPPKPRQYRDSRGVVWTMGDSFWHDGSETYHADSSFVGTPANLGEIDRLYGPVSPVTEDEPKGARIVGEVNTRPLRVRIGRQEYREDSDTGALVPIEFAGATEDEPSEDDDPDDAPKLREMGQQPRRYVRPQGDMHPETVLNILANTLSERYPDMAHDMVMADARTLRDGLYRYGHMVVGVPVRNPDAWVSTDGWHAPSPAPSSSDTEGETAEYFEPVREVQVDGEINMSEDVRITIRGHKVTPTEPPTGGVYLDGRFTPIPPALGKPTTVTVLDNGDVLQEWEINRSGAAPVATIDMPRNCSVVTESMITEPVVLSSSDTLPEWCREGQRVWNWRKIAEGTVVAVPYPEPRDEVLVHHDGDERPKAVSIHDLRTIDTPPKPSTPDAGAAD